ncbi:hypothetical protein [Ferruginibacter sp. HRS2-29]|uniref:hypothetical protein n=1 Tax=Ferruginibacter sp. HRS2-29 TaxID=2487334 RepID=UPI0020CDF03D|nr:hypothetical protein [Ferruginibacter sp. HRS2-29]MCP9752434.1 hypothetical protein [Ferruginibacter sp. HRS2-29]
MNLKERVKAPTPKFFRKLRNIAIAVVAGAGAILVSPIALPAVVTSIASYVVLAGSVMGITSHVTIKNDP